MTDRTDASPIADEALRLRLFDGPLQEADASSDVQANWFGCESELLESEEPFEGELPDDLLALAERLTSEAHALAKTYPSGSPDRLPVGEGELVEVTTPIEPTGSQAERVEEPRVVSRPARRTFGLGAAAAVGFVAVVGTAIYSAATDGSRDAVAERNVRGIEPLPSGGSSSAEGADDRPSLESVAGVPIRTVSLSLANEQDYRRLESLLRDRSEPEREAMFDLLGENDGDEETAVRIAF